MPTPRRRPQRSPTSTPLAYRPFNLVVADHQGAYWLRHAGGLPSFAFRTRDGSLRAIEPIRLPGAAIPARDRSGAIECRPLPAGLSMLTARELNDPTSPRIAHYLERWRAAAAPDPDADDWSAWSLLLADRAGPDGDPRNAMAIVAEADYGTVCSSLVALPAAGRAIMKFAAGVPGEAAFERVPA